MTTNPISEIAARYVREIDEKGLDDCPLTLRRCVAEMAHAVARDVYIEAHAVVANMPREDLAEAGRNLEAGAAVIGCRFAALLREPDAPESEAWTEIQLFGARQYWAALRRLDDTFSDIAGSA